MSPAVAELELTRPLPRLAPAGAVALLVRRRGRPLALLVRESLEAGGLEALLAEALGVRLLREALAEELGAPPPAPPVPAGHQVLLVGGAELDPGWHAALAEALAEQPDAALVAGPAVPLALPTPEAIAAELALPPRFEKLRVTVRGAGQPPALATVRVLAAAGCVVARPGAALAATPGEAIAGALRAGQAVAYEPGLLVRTPRGDGVAAARRRGAAVVSLLGAVAAAEPGLELAARRRTARWFAREARRAVKRPGARRIALAGLAGGLSALGRR